MRHQTPKINIKDIKFRHYVEYCLLLILGFLIVWIPTDVGSFMIGKGWRFFGPYGHRHSRVLRHLEWAFGDQYSAPEREKIARKMWENLGRTFYESMFAERFLKKPERFKVGGEAFNHLKHDCSDGIVLLTHHFGNWEFIGIPISSFTDHKLLAIYKKIRNPLVEAIYYKKRKMIFTGGLYSEKARAAKRAVEGVRAGYDLAMACDLRNMGGTVVNFFDMPFHVTNFPETLAVKNKKPVFVAQLRRLKGAHFVLDIEKIDYKITDDVKRDSHNLAQAVHSQFEKWIRQHPEQWMWASYRWSSRHDSPEIIPLSWNKYCKLKRAAKPKKLDK